MFDEIMPGVTVYVRPHQVPPWRTNWGKLVDDPPLEVVKLFEGEPDESELWSVWVTPEGIQTYKQSKG